MKIRLVAFVSVVVVLRLFGVSASAKAGMPTYNAIGVTGSTSWMSEYHEALRVMNSFGIPIHDGCVTGDLCVNMAHYSSNDGKAGHAVMAGNRGSVVRFNDFYDNGDRWRRVHLVVHEMGHQAGLTHSAGCDTSMNETVPACGRYVVGYNAAEMAKIRELWG